MEAFTFNTAELILLSVTGVLFIIQVIYYLGLYNRIHSHNKAVRKEGITAPFRHSFRTQRSRQSA